MENKLDLSLDFYVLNIGDPYGIPVIEQEIDGLQSVLIFTSEANAKKYCYHRNPDLIHTIFKSPKKFFDGVLLQTGLMWIARMVTRYRPYITHFVVDHSGTRGCIAQYIEVQAILNLGKKEKVQENKINELTKFLDGED